MALWFCGRTVCPNNGASVQKTTDCLTSTCEDTVRLCRIEYWVSVNTWMNLQEDSWRWEEKSLSTPETCSRVSNRRHCPGAARIPNPCGQSAGENSPGKSIPLNPVNSNIFVCSAHIGRVSSASIGFLLSKYDWITLCCLWITNQNATKSQRSLHDRSETVIGMIMTYSEAVKELAQ